MQSLGRRYVRYVNGAYRRTGTLWEGRYRAAPIDSEAYFLACCRYIELNPVRARMVGHPREYRWSSYRAHPSAPCFSAATASFQSWALLRRGRHRSCSQRSQATKSALTPFCPLPKTCIGIELPHTGIVAQREDQDFLVGSDHDVRRHWHL
jgi:hypothetical protein